jgi:hypothetical protein
MIRTRARYWNVAEYNHTPVRDNPEVSHERSDVNIRAIVGFGIALLVTAVVIHIALYWLLEYYRARSPQGAPVVSPPTAQEQTTPQPRLQISPRNDLAEMRAAEEKELTSYGWLDEKKQTVRIPIDRAMELLAQRGLGARKQTKEDQQK